MRISKKLLALGAFFVLAVAVAGCGTTVPGNSVASVAGNPITLQAYNHWMYLFAKQTAAQEEGEPVIVPTGPPQFKLCVSEIRSSVPSLASSSASTLRGYCKQAFTQFNTQVMDYLIEAYWYQADAHKLGITYSNATLMKTFDKEKKAQFKTETAFKAFLKSEGETQADILFQIRAYNLYQKLAKRVTKPVTAKAIANYYNQHKSTFGTPASRNVHLVRTADTAAGKAQAQAAYNALKSGQSWDSVAKQYAADASAKANGGLLTSVTNGEEEKAVNEAIFATPANQLVGPIHGLFGYYVLEVVKITPATQKTLAQESSTIKSQLQATATQSAESVVNKQAKANWGSQTHCLTTYSVSDCAGYKAPSTTTTTTPTTTTPATTVTGSSTTTTATTGTGTGTGTTAATTTSTTNTSTTS